MIKKKQFLCLHPAGASEVLFSKPVQTGSRAHQTPFAMKTRVLSREKKRLRIAVDHVHSFYPEVKNEWNYTSPPPLCAEILP